MARAAVHEYWRNMLQTKTDTLVSLNYMRTEFMSLAKCHPLYTACGSSPWEVEKAVTQSRLLSGRYRLESLTGHWTPGNKGGLCSLHDCWGTPSSHKGDVEAFLLTCPSLSTTRIELTISTLRFLHDKPQLEEIVRQCLMLSPVQFWLDCSTMPAVISAMQSMGDFVLVALFKMTRNYCHGLHVARNKLIDE